eukprot:5692783-Prymnesium_polylepis.3
MELPVVRVQRPGRNLWTASRQIKRAASGERRAASGGVPVPRSVSRRSTTAQVHRSRLAQPVVPLRRLASNER